MTDALFSGWRRIPVLCPESAVLFNGPNDIPGQLLRRCLPGKVSIYDLTVFYSHAWSSAIFGLPRPKRQNYLSAGPLGEIMT